MMKSSPKPEALNGTTTSIETMKSTMSLPHPSKSDTLCPVHTPSNSQLDGSALTVAMKAEYGADLDCPECKVTMELEDFRVNEDLLQTLEGISVSVTSVTEYTESTANTSGYFEAAPSSKRITNPVVSTSNTVATKDLRPATGVTQHLLQEGSVLNSTLQSLPPVPENIAPTGVKVTEAVAQLEEAKQAASVAPATPTPPVAVRPPPVRIYSRMFYRNMAANPGAVKTD